ncbi:MAG TPA: BatA domain-containing protein [Verrucomicrobiae bacterium]|nr:BatA domain-containing protein [Verrucomicrobiae bacterium]
MPQPGWRLSMSFLNPIMLVGLAAVSVPILIHLLNRRRFQKVVWAAMRFLQNAVEQNQRRMRLEDMILLALRCLLVALLALALARPAILSNASGVFGQSKVTGVIILDNSQSMGVSDGTATRLDKARRAAEAALDSMPAGSATAVLFASDIVRGAIPEPTFDLNLARKTLREAPLTDRATDLFPALQAALDTLSGRLALRKEVYLITDGQAAGWRQLTEIQRALERSKSEIKTHLILVNEHEEHNLAVSGLRLASGLSPVNQPLRFEARVTNHGKEEARNTRVSLGVNGEAPSDEFTLDSLPAGATKSVTLFTKLRSEGFHAVTARIGEDRLPADDLRTVAVRAIKEVKVLLVDGDPGNEPRDSEVFFLQNALVPVPPDAAAEYFIKTATITAPELSQARLDGYDTVVLANVPDFSEATLRAIEGYLRRGGGLMVFPGDRVNASFYNEQLFRRLKMLPAEFGAARGQAAQEDKFITFQERDYEHPIVSIWNDPGSGKVASARFFKFLELKPPPVESGKAGKRESENSMLPAFPLSRSPTEQASEAGLPRIVLKYSDGAPAVMERAWGLGRVVQFSSTADTAWNDLPVRLAWVPLLHRTLGHIVQRQDEGLNIRVGEKFVRRVAAEYLDKDATFFKPRQTDVVRELSRVELIQGWPTVQFAQTDLAGVYDATLGDPPVHVKFAAQSDPGESSLDELSPAQLATLRDVASVVVWRPDLSFRDSVEKGRTGLEFWLPIAILCLLLAAVETFLGQWFSRSK